MCRILKVNETGFYQWMRDRTKMKLWQLLLFEIYKIFFTGSWKLNLRYRKNTIGTRNSVFEQWYCNQTISMMFLEKMRRFFSIFPVISAPKPMEMAKPKFLHIKGCRQACGNCIFGSMSGILKNRQPHGAKGYWKMIWQSNDFYDRPVW